MITKQYSSEDIIEMVKLLKNDGVLGLNTDTVMGLAANGISSLAFTKLVDAKNRPANKLFPIMVSDVEMMEEIAYVSDRDKKIIARFLPGQITIVLKKKSNSNIIVDSETVAVRIVNDDVLISLVKELGSPIFLTSANKSGEPTTKYASEVYEIFSGDIEGVLMNDASAYEASTIIDLTGDDIKVLREGNISLEDIIRSLEE